MARFPSPARSANFLGPERALPRCFERLSANRFEEVNNYSDRLTRRFRDLELAMKVAVDEPGLREPRRLPQPALQRVRGATRVRRGAGPKRPRSSCRRDRAAGRKG